MLQKKTNKGPDPAEERQRREQLHNLEEQLRTLKDSFERQRLTLEIELGKLGNKAESKELEDLDEKLEARLRAIQKDLRYKEKKLERIAKAQSNENSDGNNQSSRKSLHDRNRSVDFSQTVVANALLPKLPFMK